MEYLLDYLLFLAQAATVLVVVVILIAALANVGLRRAGGVRGHLEVRRMNDRLKELKRTFEQAFVPPGQMKKLLKREAKADKAERKRRGSREGQRRRVFVLSFQGDLQASHSEQLRNEITAVLTSARKEDEILVRIESAGGMVHSYGFAASQLERIKQHGIRLTAAVDKVAASGGYLMASVADRIIVAPFALVGSIGVMAQIPNLHRFLKNHDIDFEVLTAGEHKRTLTIFGENTEEGRRKFLEELEDVHALFREFVGTNRPQVDVTKVATGEAWYGRRAIDNALVDELITSDEYLMRACDDADVYEVKWVEPRKPIERLVSGLTRAARRVLGEAYSYG